MDLFGKATVAAARARSAATCPGCAGRGTGARCAACSNTIPKRLRRQPGDPSEIRSSCRDCRAGRAHAHH